jgi:ribonuclease G
MTHMMLRDESPGEVRTGLIENGKLVEFRIVRPRNWMNAGQRFDARIVTNLGGGKALVMLDDGTEALLENAPRIPEGSRLAVVVSRPSIPEPGRWKRALVKPAPDHPVADENSESPSSKSNPDLLEAAGFDELADAAVTGEFPIEGGMLSIERTRAMTVIDIDGSGDPLVLNLAAAQEIPRLLRLLDIGGQIGVDFLNLPDRKARLAVDAALAEACAVLGQHERTAITGFGFAQIVRPRPRPSVPEILCGITPGRLSAESRALGLLRMAARSVGHGKRQLVAVPSVIALLESWPEELAAIRASLGVEIELVSDPSATGYGYVHANP